MNAGSVTRPIQWLSLAVRCRAHAFAVIVVRAIVSSSEIMHFFNAMHFFTSRIFPRKPTLKAAAGEAFFSFYYNLWVSFRTLSAYNSAVP